MSYGPRMLWCPFDAAEAAAEAARHEAVPAEPTELATVIDMRTRERIA